MFGLGGQPGIRTQDQGWSKLSTTRARPGVASRHPTPGVAMEPSMKLHVLQVALMLGKPHAIEGNIKWVLEALERPELWPKEPKSVVSSDPFPY